MSTEGIILLCSYYLGQYSTGYLNAIQTVCAKPKRNDLEAFRLPCLWISSYSSFIATHLQEVILATYPSVCLFILCDLIFWCVTM